MEQEKEDLKNNLIHQPIDEKLIHSKIMTTSSPQIFDSPIINPSDRTSVLKINTENGHHEPMIVSSSSSSALWDDWETADEKDYFNSKYPSTVIFDHHHNNSYSIEKPSKIFNNFHYRTLYVNWDIFDTLWYISPAPMYYSSSSSHHQHKSFFKLLYLSSSLSSWYSYIGLGLCRLLSLIILQYLLHQTSLGKGCYQHNQYYLKPFIKPGLLTLIQTFAYGFPFLWFQLSSHISQLFIYVYSFVSFIILQCIVYPLSRYLGLTLTPEMSSSNNNNYFMNDRIQFSSLQFWPRLSSSSSSLYSSSFETPEYLMLCIPALFDVLACWCNMLGVMTLPWITYLCFNLSSLILQCLLMKYQLITYQHEKGSCKNNNSITALGLLCLGMSLMWIINSTLVITSTYQVLVPISRGDVVRSTTTTSTTIPYEQENGIMGLFDSLKLLIIKYNPLLLYDDDHEDIDRHIVVYHDIIIKYVYATGFRSILVILGQIFRVASVFLQEMLQVSMNNNTSPQSSAYIHGFEVFGLSLLLIPLGSRLCSGGDYHGILESFTDTVVMIRNNYCILILLLCYFVSLVGAHYLGIHLVTISLIEIFITTLIDYLLFNSYKITLSCPILTQISLICGLCLCLMGFLLIANIVDIEWPPQQCSQIIPTMASITTGPQRRSNNLYQQSKRNHVILNESYITIQTAIIYLHYYEFLYSIDDERTSPKSFQNIRNLSTAEYSKLIPTKWSSFMSNEIHHGDKNVVFFDASLVAHN